MGNRRLGIEINVDYKNSGEIKALSRDLDGVAASGKKASPQLEELSKRTSGLGVSLKGIVTGGALALVGQQLIEFGKRSVAAASDVEEMQSKFNTVFKDLAGDVTGELQTFANAANRSIYDLQGFAATLQDTFVPLGFARQEAADTSVQLVKLAEDLASFNNLGTADVVRDLQSAMVGNTETLRKYGVVATQAAIDQKALEMGLEFTKGKMDAQTKAAAILAITLESTTDAQGDAIKTSDSYANQLKGMEAAMSELSIVVGQMLIPAMTELVQIGTSTIKFFTQGLENGKALSDQLKAMAELVDMNSSGFKFFAAALSAVNPAIGGVLEQKIAATQAAANLADAQAAVSARAEEMGNYYKSQATPALEENTAAMEESAIAAQEWADQYAFNAAVAADTRNETENLAVSYEDIQAAEERRKEIAEEEAEALRVLAERQRELAAATGDYFAAAIESENALVSYNEELGESQVNQDSLNQSIFDAANASGASAEQLAILGGALGLYSDEAVEAALQTALIQAKVDELADAYVNGGMSVNEMRASLNTFIAGLDTTAESMAGAASEAGALGAELDEMPRHITVSFETDYSQWKDAPAIGGFAGSAVPGAGSGLPEMDTGGIIPGGFMQPTLMIGHGGEEVLRPDDPRHVNNGGGGGVNISNLTINVTPRTGTMTSHEAQEAAGMIMEYVGGA